MGVVAFLFLIGWVALLFFMTDLCYRRRRRMDLEASRSKSGVKALDEIAPSEPYYALMAKMIRSPGAIPYSSASNTCVICIEEYDDAATIRKLPCHHFFHSECLEKWYSRRHPNCPLCKSVYQTGFLGRLAS
ncbi:hypothetical protein B0I35DRAFT_263986 [Stachybotrys elegans]|uniref:RING-type E3 ubiquitin transferase n=1 Tax=Stachybotrys elegans TaxID=80388 RepID=A0A8K0SR44_9HYPO|nr:hypothetical protein B0I35DRAFT_263986 [Stachybotrys elegans]